MSRTKNRNETQKLNENCSFLCKIGTSSFIDTIFVRFVAMQETKNIRECPLLNHLLWCALSVCYRGTNFTSRLFPDRSFTLESFYNIYVHFPIKVKKRCDFAHSRNRCNLKRKKNFARRSLLENYSNCIVLFCIIIQKVQRLYKYRTNGRINKAGEIDATKQQQSINSYV